LEFLKGNKNDLKEYYVWYEVLIDEKLVLIDTIYDAALNNKNKKTCMIKDLK